MPTLSHASILDISPYVPGKSSTGRDKPVIKLSSNENPFGCSPKVKEAITNHFDQLHRYPDGGCVALRSALAGCHAIEADRIVCGAGSDEIITLLCMAYAPAGSEVLYSQHGFLMYPIAARSVGAIPVEAPMHNGKMSVDHILAHITPNTSIIFIANPNNPTGDYISASDIQRLHDALPEHILLVIDGAYAEYVEADDYSDSLELVRNHDNIVVTRTFSKIYGIPSLRLGWCYASSAIAQTLNRVRGPFNVTSLAQIAGLAALEDQSFVAQSRSHNNGWITKLTDALLPHVTMVFPTVGNFILVDFGSREKAHAASDALQQNNIIVRKMDAYQLPHCLRITIGTDSDNHAVIQTIKDSA